MCLNNYVQRVDLFFRPNLNYLYHIYGEKSFQSHSQFNLYDLKHAVYKPNLNLLISLIW